MTTNLEEAIDNARRHGKPVILEIDTECLKKKHIPVYRAGKNTYLAPYIPPECIKRWLNH